MCLQVPRRRKIPLWNWNFQGVLGEDNSLRCKQNSSQRRRKLCLFCCVVQTTTNNNRLWVWVITSSKKEQKYILRLWNLYTVHKRRHRGVRVLCSMYETFRVSTAPCYGCNSRLWFPTEKTRSRQHRRCFSVVTTFSWDRETSPVIPLFVWRKNSASAHHPLTFVHEKWNHHRDFSKFYFTLLWSWTRKTGQRSGRTDTVNGGVVGWT